MMNPLALPARRIVVIAPHPDDESLGCGGLIAALAADRREILVVFITDGAGSHPNSPAWPAARLSEQRRQEGWNAVSRLGVRTPPPLFLNLPDAAMPNLESPEGQAAVARLSDELMAFRTDLMLLPWRRDPHRDHRDAWALAHAALARAGDAGAAAQRSTAPRPAMLEYAVWLDELGAEGDHPQPGEAELVAFDIAPVLALKRRAVEAHLSQTTDLIDDDPDGFRLTAATIDRLVGPVERYWRPLS